MGALCGDALGATPEGQHLTQSQIRALGGGQKLRKFVAGEHLGMWEEGERVGMYTDDSSCVLALATSLVRCGGLDAADAARSYGEWWLLTPFRGYPESAQAVLMAVLEGISPAITGRIAFPGGSYANGAAMRIAPVGLTFHHATDDQLRIAVASAVVSSHVHPEAVDAAVVLAKAIGHVLSVSPRSSRYCSDRQDEIMPSSPSDPLRWIPLGVCCLVP